MKKGFTLIELLVVVLIIGILSAIALPQYQKAVEKARFAEVRLHISALEKAMDMYILENGWPSGTIQFLGSNGQNVLDIDLKSVLQNTQWPTTSSSKYYYYQADCGLCNDDFGPGNHCCLWQVQAKNLPMELYGQHSDTENRWIRHVDYSKSNSITGSIGSSLEAEGWSRYGFNHDD